MSEIIIRVESTSGKETELKVLSTDKISEAKRKYIDAGGNPNLKQWKFDGKVLKDNETIDELGIEDEDKISSVEATRGGRIKINKFNII